MNGLNHKLIVLTLQNAYGPGLLILDTTEHPSYLAEGKLRESVEELAARMAVAAWTENKVWCPVEMRIKQLDTGEVEEYSFQEKCYQPMMQADFERRLADEEDRRILETLTAEEDVE